MFIFNDIIILGEEKMTIKDLMIKINEDLKRILGNHYVGVYFHGSLRLGSFNPNKSDLDFIIVINSPIIDTIKKSICDYMISNRKLFPKKGFEFSVVLEKYCTNFVYPTPYELHMSEDWIERYLNDPRSVINDEEKVDSDLASHFNVINQPNEDMDFGGPSSEVFCIVPKDYVLDSNWGDIANSEEDITKNPTYSILNLCRFYAYIKDGLTLSKYDGGKWAQNNLEWNSKLILSAMNDYMEDINPQYDTSELYDFAKKAIHDIKSFQHGHTK